MLAVGADADSLDDQAATGSQLGGAGLEEGEPVARRLRGELRPGVGACLGEIHPAGSPHAGLLAQPVGGVRAHPEIDAAGGQDLGEEGARDGRRIDGAAGRLLEVAAVAGDVAKELREVVGRDVVVDREQREVAERSRSASMAVPIACTEVAPVPAP